MLSSQSKNYLLISAVIVLALSYFYQVPNNPPGFYIDESSIAYNAYTISKTGHDEYGESWPLYFRAFGEYKNPVYIYLLATLFKLFGPSILVARLFSAALSVVAILLLWLLSFRLSRQTTVASLVAISAFLTPWLFENSRLSFEVALYPVLVVLFLLVVQNASTKERWNFVDSVLLALTLSLLTYSYSIGRLFAPLLAFGLLFFVTRTRLRGLLTSFGLYALALLPTAIFHCQHPNALTSRFWLLTYITPQQSIFQVAIAFVSHYLVNINPWTIAVTGEINFRDHVGSMGSVLAPSLLISIVGILWVILHPAALGAQASPPAVSTAVPELHPAALGAQASPPALSTAVPELHPAALGAQASPPALSTAVPELHPAGEDACAPSTSTPQIAGAWWRFMLYSLFVSPIPASLTTTEFPQIRLIALPVLLHVFMVPTFSWLVANWSRRRLVQTVSLVLLFLLFTQGVVYRFQFRKVGPERGYIFDEQFPKEVLPTALAQNKSPIYFYDPPGKSGYVQAYWYGVLRDLPPHSFVRLPFDGQPPQGAVVISTAEECSNCRLLLKSINYIVYIAGKD